LGAHDSAVVISVTFLNLRDKGGVPSQYVCVCWPHIIHLSQ